MEQGGDDRLLVQLEVGHQTGDFDRMTEIGVAAGAFLAAVPLYRKHIGAVDQIFVCIGIIGSYPFHQFILSEHILKMVRFRGWGNKKERRSLLFCPGKGTERWLRRYA